MNNLGCLLTSALLLSFAFTALATTRYVDVNGVNPIPPYTNWATAASNIQDAVDVATANDQIVVTNGVYRAGNHSSMGVLTVTNGLKIQSVNGPDSTVIDGEGLLRCAYLDGNTFLSGFTLTRGTNSEFVGGVYCLSSKTVISNCVITCNSSGERVGGVGYGTIKNSIISSNSAPVYGGGCMASYLENCTLIGNFGGEGGGVITSTASNCSFVANSANWGGGAYQSTLLCCIVSSNTASIQGGGAYWGTVENCIIQGNSAKGSGGGLHQAGGRGCAIYGNTAEVGGGVYLSSLSNCTIVANSAIQGGGAEDSTLRNCIVYYNNAPIGANWNGVRTIVSYSCTTPVPPGVGNFSNEPQLASASHLSGDSPSRMAGVTNYAKGRDIDGESWLKPPSVGCDEYNTTTATGVVSVAICTAYTNVAAGQVLDLSCQISGRLTASRWEFGDGTVVSNRPYTSHSWPAPGDYLVVARGYNQTFPTGAIAGITIHVVSQPIHYVSLQSTNPLTPFNSWATAATNIQDAVDAATVSGAKVLVGGGVYDTGQRAISAQTNRLVVDRPILVQSLEGPQHTMIRGIGNSSNTRIRCVYLAAHAYLIGFTLTDGATTGGGAGVWCASAESLVADCVLSNNACIGGYDSRSEGGAVFSGTVSNCVLLNNSAYSGGGAAWSQLSGCVASSNLATLGAAAYFCTAAQTTLINNSANNYGGGAYGSTLRKCALTGNSAYYGGGGAYGGTLIACLLKNNHTSTFGAGVSGGTLEGCLLVGNDAASRGGGANGSTLYNCTLIGNSAPAWGGGGAADSTLNNCIVYHNAAPTGANSLDSILNYCCTTPAHTNGAGNITNEPSFVNLAGSDFHLQTNSPCINSGNNSYSTGVTDLDGRPRIVGGTVDIGAYEYQSANIAQFISWLQLYALPTDGSADYADTDGDHLNNWHEWRADTVPTNAFSRLALAAPTIAPTGLAVTWQSQATRSYFLERGTNLADTPAFLSLATNIAGQSGTTSYADTTATNGGPFFYRVGVQ